MLRERLYKKLDTDSALVVVHAPAGGGKTVAVADWAANSPTHPRGAWVTVREESTARPGFWRMAIQVLADAGLLPDDSILVRSIHSLDEVTDLRELLRRGFAQLHHPLVVIFDDAHLIADDQVYSDLVDVLASSPRLRVIVLTRIMSPLESTAVRLSLSPVLIAPDNLVLSTEDTRAALTLAGVEEPEPAFAEALYRAVDGNPLLTRGVILAIQRGEIDTDVDSLRDSLTNVGTDLLREVILLRPGAPEEIDFALRCSIPDMLTVDLARALSGRRDADVLLGLAETSGVGMWSDSAAGRVFTFSPLFQKALRSEVRRRFPGEVAGLHRTSAEWAQKTGRVFTALSHAIEAGDLSLASDIVMQDWKLMIREHTTTLTSLIGSLPLRTLHRAPLLTMMLAMTYNVSGEHKARAMEMFGISAASARLRGKKEPKARRLVLSLIESAALRLIGHIDGALAAADRALALRDELSIEERDELSQIYPTLLCQLGQTYFYGGRNAQAIELFREALAYPRGVTENGWYHGLALTAGASAVYGELDEAIRVVEISRAEPWPEGWYDGYIYHVAEAHLALEEFDFDRALHHMNLLAPHFDTIEHWPVILQAQSLARLGRGEITGAIAALETEPGRRSRSLTAHIRLQLDVTRALLFLAAGRVAEAERALKKHPKTSPARVVAAARIALVSDSPEEAVQSIVSMLAKERDLSPRIRAEALLLQAAAASRTDRGDYALTILDEAAVLLRDQRMRFPLMLIPRADLEALKQRADAAGVTLAGGLLDRLDDIPDVLPVLPSSVALTRRELVVLEHLASTGNVAEIAGVLFVSTNTVKSQLRSIYRKLGVSSREEALVAAIERRMIAG